MYIGISLLHFSTVKFFKSNNAGKTVVKGSKIVFVSKLHLSDCQLQIENLVK